LLLNADILSDMKTFTVRQLDREPSVVLDACDKDGAVRIRRRDGRAYTLQPTAAAGRMSNLPDFRARLRKAFKRPIPAKQTALVDRLIAGE